MSSAGIAAVAQGMAAAESITGKIGINLSNANTPGYKAFGNYLLSETSKYNGGVTAVSRVKADIQGGIIETKNEFDYAIEGAGFFVVDCKGEKKYTTAGRFEKDNDGFLSSPNGCYLLGELYTDDDQNQKQAIANPKPIKLTSSTIKGHETTTADINVKLSAQAPIVGGGKAQMMIDANSINDGDSFLMNFYQHDGDKSTAHSFIMIKDSNAAKDDVKIEGTKTTIKYKDRTDLKGKIPVYMKSYIRLIVSSGNVQFELANNNTRLQFEDGTADIIKDKIAPKDIDSGGNMSTTDIKSGEFVKSWYDPDKNDYNFSGSTGKYEAGINSEFSVIDSKDNEHKVFMAFVRTGFNEYSVEIFLPDQEKTSTSPNVIKSGKITFDPKTGKGTPSADLNDITINFDAEGEKITSTFKLDWEKINMYGSIFNADITTNGKKEGTLVNTSIDKKGNLTGHYSNGDDKLIAAIPVAIFKDPMKLQNEFGTVFSSTAESGSAVLSVAGQNGAGMIVGGSLEGSNVDETKSMTDLMQQQRFYSYNAKAYGIMNNMEDVLLGIIHT